jgi:hypothetical protein
MSYSEFVLNQLRKGIAEEKNPKPRTAKQHYDFTKSRNVQKALFELESFEQRSYFKYAKGVPPSPAQEHFLNLTIRKRNYTDQCWMNMKVKDLKFGHPDKERAMAAGRIVTMMLELQETYRYKPGTIVVSAIDTWLNEEWRQHVDRYVKGEFEITSWSGRASPTNKTQVPRLQFVIAGDRPKKTSLVF